MSIIVTSAPALLHPTYVSGRTYSTYWGQMLNSAAMPAIDIIYFYPFLITRTLAFASGSARVQTAGAGSSIKVGIWANSPTSSRAVGAPVAVDNTGITTQASTTDVVPAISGTLYPGWYWMGIKTTGTPATFHSITAPNLFMSWAMGNATSPLMVVTAFSIADTYSNNMPTIAEAAAFTPVTASGVPVIGLTIS